MHTESIQRNVQTLAAAWAAERTERQRRRELVRADFDRLAAAGFLLTGVPLESGGIWQDVSHSTRTTCELLRTLAKVEWARVEMDAWLVLQAYEGMLRAMETSGPEAARATVLAKTAIAELAESATSRICRVIGGGTFARSSAFGNWAEDVRALGFLRPPWGLAFDLLANH